MKRKYPIPILFMVLLLMPGCAFFGRAFNRNAEQNAINAGYAAYVKASRVYDDESVKYQAAHNIVKGTTLTAEQASDYQRVRSEVRAADNDVYADLEAWELDGIEPPEFKAHRSKLKSAQTRMILLSREVSGGGR